MGYLTQSSQVGPDQPFLQLQNPGLAQYPWLILHPYKKLVFIFSKLTKVIQVNFYYENFKEFTLKNRMTYPSTLNSVAKVSLISSFAFTF